jgi:hypothetical protein
LRILLPTLLAAAFGVSLNATTVFYNTSGAFTGGTTSTNSDFINFSDGSGDTVTITFDYDTGDSATSSGSATNASFGTFVTTVSNPSATVDIPTTVFVLTINQTGPGSIGSTNDSPITLNGTLSAGTISGTSSTVGITFSPASGSVNDTVTPGTATYTMFFTPIVPPSSGGGDSTLSGTLTYVASQVGAVPEPATMAMMGAGLLALGLVQRRRKSN